MTASRKFSLGEYFARTLPPLDGRLRFVVVGLLFALSQRDVFDRMAQRIATCPEGFYEPAGMMGLIGPQVQSEMAAWAGDLRVPLTLTWIAAIVGLFGRWSLLLTGLQLLFLQGWYKGCVGTGHAWYLPAYTLTLLGAAGGTDRWSVDALIARKQAWYPFRPAKPDSVAATGLGRSLVLCCVVFIMASAGLSKLREAGWVWMNGESLQFYLKTLSMPKDWGRWLHDILIDNLALCSLLSVFTFVIELGAPILLFSQRARFPYVLAAWGFHLGIMALMIPRYLPQMVCYLLIVDWGRLFGLERRLPQAALLEGAPPVEPEPPLSPRVRQVCAVAGTLLSVVLIGTAVVRREWYPLSHIPMYSSQLGPGIRGGLPLSEWHDPEGFRRICQGYVENERPNVFQSYVGRRVGIALRTPRGAQPVTQPLTMRHTVMELTVWVERSAQAVAADVSAQPLEPLRVEGGGAKPVYDFTRTHQATRSERLLRLLVPTALKMGMAKKGTHLELFYPEENFVLVLARVPLE